MKLDWDFLFPDDIDEQDHQTFLGHLDESYPAVQIAANILRKKGLSVKINPTSRAPNYRDWKKHVDSGDLEVMINGQRQIIEVKQRSFDFTGPHNYGPGNKVYPDCIVCAKHSFDTKHPQPKAYMIFSNDLKAYGVIKSDTLKSWTVRPVTDHRYKNVTQDCYHCPLVEIIWRLNNDDQS